MAIVAAIKAKTQSKTAMKKVMDYVAQDKKTLYEDKEIGQTYKLISGQNCVAETAYQEFMATKIQYGKDHGVFYKQFVQSFKPEETATPKEIHQMGVELAEYFKDFEVLVATHIDEDHWHNHLIINAVNAETGLKIQFNEKSLKELRERSDEICHSHGLETLKPYDKNSQVAGMNTREFRAAAKGDSWKFKLMSAIDSAMSSSQNKGDFIANMEKMGYGVKWIDHYKYITYTTPEGQKCRDNRLHEEKYLKERMVKYYDGHERIKVVEQAGKSNRRIQSESAVLRNPAGSIGKLGFDDNRNRQVSSTHAGRNQPIADMGSLGERDSAENRQGNEPHVSGGQGLRERPAAGLSAEDGQSGIQDYEHDSQQFEGRGAYGGKNGGAVAGTRQSSVEATPQMDGNRDSVAASVLRAARALESLVLDQPKEKGEQQQQVIERKNQQKKKQKHSHEHEWEMEM